MKVSIWLCLLILLSVPAFAQTPTSTGPTVPVTYPPIYPVTSEYDKSVRVLVGVQGGDDFDNLFVGPAVGVAVPIGNHFELSASDSFSPVEAHVALGSGYSNNLSAGGVVWLTKGFGLNGSYSYGGYWVSKAHKTADYTYSGVTFRRFAFGMPARISLDYVQQVHNGIACGGVTACSAPGANQTETSHLQGAKFDWLTRYGCSKHFCVDVDLSVNGGRILEQGPAYCDGSLGPVTCPRTVTSGGGVSVSVVFDLGHKDGDRLF